MTWWWERRQEFHQIWRVFPSFRRRINCVSAVPAFSWLLTRIFFTPDKERFSEREDLVATSHEPLGANSLPGSSAEDALLKVSTGSLDLVARNPKKIGKNLPLFAPHTRAAFGHHVAKKRLKTLINKAMCLCNMVATSFRSGHHVLGWSRIHTG